jgi:hypothetical protein
VMVAMFLQCGLSYKISGNVSFCSCLYLFG